MKLFGYLENGSDELATLREVTIQGDSAAVRKVAKFLESCADQMDADSGWEHEHYRDWADPGSADEDPDVIVFRSED